MRFITCCCTFSVLILTSVSSYGEENLDSIPFQSLAKSCSPSSEITNINTLSALAKIESNGNPLALHVNGYVIPRQPTNVQEAQAAVAWLSEHQYNFDVGLLQINSGNFRKLGVIGRDLIDPCKNIAASASILTDCYKFATKTYSENALEHSISCYNTGSLQKGFANGYVEKFKKATGSISARAAKQKPLLIPALTGSSSKASTEVALQEQPKQKKKKWGVDDVFASDNGDVFASGR